MGSRSGGREASLNQYRIDSGPGYRIYFGQDGETLIVLLGGGTKRRQQVDMAASGPSGAGTKEETNAHLELADAGR